MTVYTCRINVNQPRLAKFDSNITHPTMTILTKFMILIGVSIFYHYVVRQNLSTKDDNKPNMQHYINAIDDTHIMKKVLKRKLSYTSRYFARQKGIRIERQ